MPYKPHHTGKQKNKQHHKQHAATPRAAPREPALNVARHREMQLRREIREATQKAFALENERMDAERLQSQLDKLAPNMRDAVVKILAKYK